MRLACFSLLLATSLLSACTIFVKTNAVSHSESKTVAADRLLAYQARNEGSAELIVTRDAGFMGSGCYIGLVLNGQLAARFDPSETASFYLAPGAFTAAVIRDPQGRGLCSAGGWDPVPESYEVKADAPNYYRISLGAYRRPRLLPSVY